MYYKLLSFSQKENLRTFWFRRTGPIGAVSVPFTVLADTRVAREHRVPLQELPALCTRMLSAISEDERAGSLTVSEADFALYAAELDAARADTEAARKRRSARSMNLKKSAETDQVVT